MEVYATEHIIPHDDSQAVMVRMNIVKKTTYVSNEQVNRQQAVFLHVQFTCLTQTHMKNLHMYPQHRT